MIIAGKFTDRFSQLSIDAGNIDQLTDALWIDLVNPTREEEQLIEQCFSIDVPTREEMVEIELSSRLYKENDTLFMTATMVAQAESLTPKQDAVTFILMKNHLITVRYIDPQAFKLFTNRINKIKSIDNSSTLLTELLDATVDRLADFRADQSPIRRLYQGYLPPTGRTHSRLPKVTAAIGSHRPIEL